MLPRTSPAKSEFLVILPSLRRRLAWMISCRLLPLFSSDSTPAHFFSGYSGLPRPLAFAFSSEEHFLVFSHPATPHRAHHVFFLSFQSAGIRVNPPRRFFASVGSMPLFPSMSGFIRGFPPCTPRTCPRSASALFTCTQGVILE